MTGLLAALCLLAPELLMEVGAGRPFGSGASAFDTGGGLTLQAGGMVSPRWGLYVQATGHGLRLDDTGGVDGAGLLTVGALAAEVHPWGIRRRWRPYVGPVLGAGRTTARAVYEGSAVTHKAWALYSGLRLGAGFPVAQGLWLGPAVTALKPWPMRECTALGPGLTACTEAPELKLDFVYQAGLSLRWTP